jgi:hypothetical protein
MFLCHVETYGRGNIPRPAEKLVDGFNLDNFVELLKILGVVGQQATRVVGYLRIKRLLVLPVIGNTIVCCPSKSKHISEKPKAFLGTGWIVSVPHCLTSFQGHLSTLENCFHYWLQRHPRYFLQGLC